MAGNRGNPLSFALTPRKKRKKNECLTSSAWIFLGALLPWYFALSNAGIPNIQYYRVVIHDAKHEDYPDMETVTHKITKRRPRDTEVFDRDSFKIRDERERCSVTEDLNRNAYAEHKSKDGRRDA